MSTLRKDPGFEGNVTMAMVEARHKAMNAALGRLLHDLLSNLPVEDGHGHEAILSALTDEQIAAKFPRVRAVMQMYESKRSGDPEATANGHGTHSVGDRKTTVTIQALLPFLHKLEEGLLIHADVYGNRGPKVNPVRRPQQKGPLYGPRREGKGGILVWREAGQIRRATVRKPKKFAFLKKALSQLRTWAIRLGGKGTKYN